MRNLTSLTDEQIESKFKKLGYGLCVSDLTFTKETIEDFKSARKEYAQSGSLHTDRDGVLEVSDVQVKKGTQRKNLVVIDLDEIRAVYCM